MSFILRVLKKKTSTLNRFVTCQQEELALSSQMPESLFCFFFLAMDAGLCDSIDLGLSQLAIFRNNTSNRTWDSFISFTQCEVREKQAAIMQSALSFSKVQMRGVGNDLEKCLEYYRL